MRLAVMHNLFFYNHMMEEIRESLNQGFFEDYRKNYTKILDQRI
jgi:queuine tRNA-ribosyltransferase